MKKLFFGMMVASFFFITVACGGDESEPLIDASASGTIDVMVWSGDGAYHEDLGHQEWAAEDITGQNVAALYATAKAFNEKYPNVKINCFAKADDPNGAGVSWEQELENFNTDHGKYPDVWASNSVTRDMGKGLILDLSMFKEDSLYKTFNPSLLQMTNYYGFQGGLPQYILPWSCYVNKSLAETNNIEVPDFDWDWEEYTDFVASADITQGYYGAMDAGMDIIRMAVIERQLMNNEIEGAHVDVTTTEFASAITKLTTQGTTAVNTQHGLGNITDDDMNLHGYWGYRFFYENALLTYTGDPWMMGVSTIEGDGGEVQAEDWDIYPMPSVAGSGTFVSAVLDPVVVYNYCGDNGCDEAETEKAKIAFAFTSFWTADTDSWQARADQQYVSSRDAANNPVLKSSLNDSFPMVTGEEFDKQMDIWYSVASHIAYSDAEKFPGFQEVVRLWNEGKIYATSDKAFPLQYKDESGISVNCLQPILDFGNTDYSGGVSIDSRAWANTYNKNLQDTFNAQMNADFDKAYAQLRTALTTFYGYTEDMFN